MSLDFWMVTGMVGVPAAVVVVAILAGSAQRNRQERLLATTGRGAVGRVLTSGFDDDGLGARSYWVKVEFDYDGETVNAKVGLSYRDRQRYQPGQRVGLTYAPSRHQVVRLDPPEWSLPRAR
jgi:Protein of unknown function (DUF3592)